MNENISGCLRVRSDLQKEQRSWIAKPDALRIMTNNQCNQLLAEHTMAPAPPCPCRRRYKFVDNDESGLPPVTSKLYKEMAP